MRKRIVFFGPISPPSGGIATFTQNLYYSLLSSKERFVLIAPSQENVCKKNVVQMAPKPWYMFQWAFHLSYAEICLDSLEIGLEYPNWKLAIFWWLLKKIFCFRWIKIIHNGSLPERYLKFSKAQKNIFRLMLSNVDNLVTANETLANWFKLEHGYQKPITVVNPLLPSEEEVEKTYALPEGIGNFIKKHQKNVVSIGLFDKKYGFDQIAKVVQEIRQEHNINIGLVLIDGAVTNDPLFKKTVVKDNDWIFVASKVKNITVSKVLSLCDVYVRASQFESYGISRVEALFCGLPVIATKVGETRGMLTFEFGNEIGLKEQLIKALFFPSFQDNLLWQEFYRQQAQENLSKIQSLLDIPA